MIVKKKASGNFAKQGEDFKDGDMLSFIDAGTEQEGEYGVQKVFTMKFPSGENKLLTINQTSINNLIDGGYAEDTEQWIGKKAKVELLKQMVGGKIKLVTYLFAVGENGEAIPF